MLAEAEAAGARIARRGREMPWGDTQGTSATSTDTCGRMAWNPGFPLGEHGAVTLPWIMDQLDILRCARIVMDSHGDDAPNQAAMRADELDAAGDEAGRRGLAGDHHRHRRAQP